MADLFTLGTYADTDTWSSGQSKDTGDLRRKFNFGDRVSELAIAQDPFFRFVSKVSKKPTDDPEFKFTERRPSYHKRYSYVVGYNNGSDVFDDANLKTTADADLTTATGETVKLLMATDYKSAGNISNVFGQTGSANFMVGASGTEPGYFLPGQIVKVNLSNTDEGGGGAGGSAITSVDIDDYVLCRIDTVHTSTSTGSLTNVNLADGADDVTQTIYYTPITCTTVRAVSNVLNKELTSFISDTPLGLCSTASVADVLEPMRAYVVGTSHAQGSGYPETWKDQPFTTGFGLTQIWKTAMAMDNTTRATVLKYEPNEWARIWREKLIEHKWDIETSLLFGSQGTADSIQYTQGAVDFITGYGNVFSLTHATKTADDFLNDMSSYLDPRYNNANATLFFCDTATYNWLHKLSGFFANNVANVQPGGFDGTDASSTYPAPGTAWASKGSADFAQLGKKNVFGLAVTTIGTPYGDMNLVRNVHLDGTSVKLLAINMRYCAYRPLVGNGLNRDTAVYVGVQTLENSGVDRRVDLIQTEAGMEWQMPEAHAYWA